MAKVYTSICIEIDELAIKILHLSEKLVQLKLEVEKMMNNGFVNIAKARYIMGTKCVSTLQLPTSNSNPLQSMTTVCRSCREGYWTFKPNRRKPSPLPSDEKLLKEKFKTNTARPYVIQELLEKDHKNIRKRKEFYLVNDGNYKELNDELQDEMSTSSSDSVESQIVFTDPIRLFGVLVPHTLRSAQKNFQDVIDIILNCATVQSEINMVLNRYYHLVKVKKMIENAAEERGFDLQEVKEYWTPDEMSDISKTITEISSETSVAQESEMEKDTQSIILEETSKSLETLEILGEDEEFGFPSESADYLIGHGEQHDGEICENDDNIAHNSDISPQK